MIGCYCCDTSKDLKKVFNYYVCSSCMNEIIYQDKKQIVYVWHGEIYLETKESIIDREIKDTPNNRIRIINSILPKPKTRKKKNKLCVSNQFLSRRLQ
jgi:hypothetical protein